MYVFTQNYVEIFDEKTTSALIFQYNMNFLDRVYIL